MLDFRLQLMKATITNVFAAIATVAVMSIAVAQDKPAAKPTGDDGRKEVSRKEAKFTKALIITLANGNEQTYFPPREGSMGQITLRAEEANEKGRTLRSFAALVGQRPEIDGKIYGELTIFNEDRREIVYGYFHKDKFLDIPPDADIYYRAVIENGKKDILRDRLSELPKF